MSVTIPAAQEVAPAIAMADLKRSAKNNSDMPAPRKKSKYWSRPKNAPVHPYVAFEGSPLWRVVKKALADLEKNQDIELKEWHQYVVGYVCKQISRSELVSQRVIKKTPNQSPQRNASATSVSTSKSPVRHG